MKPGKCYQNTIQALMAGTYDTADHECMLCHGYPRLTKACQGVPAGTLYGHAWLERGNGPDRVYIDVESGKCFVWDVCYLVGQIDPTKVKRYTKAEAWENLKKHRHHGPWIKPPVEAVFASNKSN